MKFKIAISFLLFTLASCKNTPVIIKHTCRWEVMDFACGLDNMGLWKMKCKHGYYTSHYALLYSIKTGEHINLELEVVK